MSSHLGRSRIRPSEEAYLGVAVGYFRVGRNHSLRLYQTGRYSRGERGETVQAGTEGGTLSPPRLNLSENDLVCDPERYVGSDGVTDYCYLSRKYCCSSDFSDDHEDSGVPEVSERASLVDCLICCANSIEGFEVAFPEYLSLALFLRLQLTVLLPLASVSSAVSLPGLVSVVLAAAFLRVL